MKKFWKISILPVSALFLLSACKIPFLPGRNSSESNHYGDSSGGGQQEPTSFSSSQSSISYDGEWANDVQDEMRLYLGTVLPYAPLDLITLDHGYSDSYETSGFGLYYLFDDNNNNVMTGYGDVLTRNGFTKATEDGVDYYLKDVSAEISITVVFGWEAATADYLAGNFINVMCPIYAEPVSEEALIDAGYEKVQGWPAKEIAAVVEGTGLTVPSIKEDSEWFLLTGLEEGLFGNYYYACLAIESLIGEEYGDLLVADSNFYYDEDYAAYFSNDDEVEIDVSEDNGFTLIGIYGPYLEEQQEPVTEESLIDAGYEKVQGWPTAIIASVLEGSGFSVPSFKEDSEWYLLSGLENSEYGDYYYACLAIEGEFADEYADLLVADGDFYYDSDYETYFSSDDEVNVDIAENNGFTLIDIYGPYLTPDPVSEQDNGDGTVTVVIDFTALLEGQDYDGYEFVSTSATVTTSKNGGNNPPAYYETSNTLRFYPKNQIVIQTLTGYSISSVDVEIGSNKNLTASDLQSSGGTSQTTDDGVKFTNIGTGSFTLTVDPAKTSGNLGIASLTIVIATA